MKDYQANLKLVAVQKPRRRKRITICYPRFICFILGVVLLCILIGTLAFHAQADAPVQLKTLTHYETITVRYGDTLLGIAEQYSPDENVRGFMWEIMQHNDLDDTKIVAGEKLSVPIYAVQQCSAKQMR